jgi:signal peptidase II
MGAAQGPAQMNRPLQTRSEIRDKAKSSQLRLWGSLSSLGLSLAVLSFAADQLFKWWMLRILEITEGQPIEITPFFSLVLAWNQGVSYGWLAKGGEIGRIGLTVISLLASAALWIWLARTPSPLVGAGLGLIIGGALGNALDRVAHGAVADFFLFHAFGYSWYVFNVADVAIVAGVLALIYDSVSEKRRKST